MSRPQVGRAAGQENSPQKPFPGAEQDAEVERALLERLGKDSHFPPPHQLEEDAEMERFLRDRMAKVEHLREDADMAKVLREQVAKTTDLINANHHQNSKRT